MKVLTTLAERDYFYGLAALLNSVVKQGTYVDKVIVGYREGLPDWLPTLTDTAHGRGFATAAGLEVEFVELTGSKHMVHEKPKWFAHLAEVLAPHAEEYFFFDSDIILNRRMSFFGEWVAEGIGVCGDINYPFERRHPIRRKWARAAEEAGLAVRHQYDHYYNSGFLAWKNEHKAFLKDWERAFSVLAPYSGDMKQFRVYDRTAMVLSTNQDSLNLAMMITELPMAPIGPEAMGFTHGMRMMYHPIGPKPWRREFVKEFAKGSPPREADVAFWESVNGSVLRPFPDGRVRRMVRLCRGLRLMARSYTSH